MKVEVQDITLQHLQTDIIKWANDTFPFRSPQQGFLKMFEEVGEVLGDPTNHHEWADVFIMMLDLAGHYGISGNDLVVAIGEKMEINKKRTWIQTSVGVMKHSPEAKTTKTIESSER